MLDPGLKIVNVADTFDLDVIINSGAQLLDGVEVYVNFDHTVMQVANVIPDLSSFPDNVTGPTWDNGAGHIGYAAGLLSGPEPSGSFRVATIRFLATAPAGGTVISFAFHPPSRDTKVSHDGMSWRPVGAGSIILISEPGVATSTPTVTPTSVTPTATPTPTATATVPSGPSGTVSGRVLLEGRSNHSGAVVTVGGRSATTAANGTFTVTNVPVGVWTVRADAQSYLFADRTGVVVVDGGLVEWPDGGLYGGDCSGDGFIDLFDMVIVGMAYDAIPGDVNWDPTADVNGDSVVDIVDLVLIGSNYEKLAPTAWAMF